MRYQNAKEVLPEQLLKEVQRYAAGMMLYVPAPECRRRGSGEAYRRELAERNRRIWRDRQRGMSAAALGEKYFLSEKSIQRILRQINQQKR